MKIGIGMIAYNEAALIERTIESLFSQTLFGSELAESFYVVCVPNGCTDDTARIAGDSLVQ